MATATASSHATHSFKNTIALITEANKGIGFETARQLGKQGIIVLIGTRDKVHGEEAVKKLKQEKINAKFIHIDVSNQDLIKKAVEQIQQEYEKLDILINNAAIHLESEPPSKTPMKTLRKTFETSFFGVFAVTQPFYTILTKMNCWWWSNSDRNKLAYSTSKTALNMMTYQFAKELANSRSNIKINSVDSDSTQTNMTGNNVKFAPVEDAADPIAYFATLPSNGSSGQFFNPKKQLHPW
ncbi:unnamed protein product [Rotaria sp. Silwood2]|nr:unnamed protein product [Rotaria sp. Silwood2]CAF3051208.1 unnamed protein product [Rotaria sp. Silwood2]CAF3373336.1 unnamed protein product [Rotaria sp. Silwood2]CAF4275884.1 unnamed protein product [Rotaria sp. Silwood2]CAF4311824.1 unnamed protein product [Rotaria sp. Silwood2]